MGLREWCSKNGSSLSEIMRSAGVAYTTVLAAADGRLSRYDIAVRISDATRGEVSPAELCKVTAREARKDTGTEG